MTWSQSRGSWNFFPNATLTLRKWRSTITRHFAWCMNTLSQFSNNFSICDWFRLCAIPVGDCLSPHHPLVVCQSFHISFSVHHADTGFFGWFGSIGVWWCGCCFVSRHNSMATSLCIDGSEFSVLIVVVVCCHVFLFQFSIPSTHLVSL